MRTIEEIKTDIEKIKMCETTKKSNECKFICGACPLSVGYTGEYLFRELVHTITSNIPFSRLEEICEAERDGGLAILHKESQAGVYCEKTVKECEK